ncbi:hypothetical protein MKZ20_14770 [Psychrobacillus sp. FSL K6-2684]|uniref:hypothetical protein n=1 Tax=Psychrobacillus sp. FSL K6-2684 TaxID=2921547 RepID=UPI0030F70645
MIAEIRGKISRSGSNLTERLEDNLTGNVFGALRYLPYERGNGKDFDEGGACFCQTITIGVSVAA